MLKKWIKNKMIRSSYFIRILKDRHLFEYFQSQGIHVVKNHFYKPVPDTSILTKEFFQKQYSWQGIDLNESEQVKLLTLFSSTFKPEYSLIPFNGNMQSAQYYWDNGGFQCLDAISLYGMIRFFKPEKIIEVGGGNSTKLSASAILKNQSEGKRCEFTTIDPHPWEIHQKGLPGLSKVIDKPVQEIPVSFFQRLNENDILFIDTSHILKTGSDLVYLFMDVLPHLNAGVFIHFHDIFLPEEYPEEWVMQGRRFFNEQYILRAFLSFNNAFRIIFAGRYLQLTHPQLVQQSLDFYPASLTKAGSFWIQKIK